MNVPAERLSHLVASILRAEGLPQEDARTVAALMVEADLLGGDGHGVFRLPRYLERLRAGGFNPRPNIRIDRERGAMAVVDGDNGFGHLVMKRCAEEAVARAQSHGVGWVGAHHSNHAGVAGVYAMMPLAHDMIGLYVAVGNANHMAPWGGIDLLLSTNPIAVAVPSAEGRKPILLDLATTVAAYGKVKLAAQRGEPMPEGWMVGRDGCPLTDPARREEGFLLPIGGPKGYGLALAIGLLAGILNGAACGRDVIDFTKDTTSPTNTGQFVAAIRVSAFAEPELFGRTVDAVFDQMRASAPLPGHDPVRIPGERREATRRERSAAGVPLHRNLWNELAAIAGELGIDALSPASGER